MKSLEGTSTVSKHEAPEFISTVAEATGASDAAVKVILSILACYPIAAMHRILVRKLGPAIQNIFFATCGFLLCYFNYGVDSCHSAFAILMAYTLILLFSRKPRLLVALNFVLQMGYLLMGYRYTESNSYDILWTTPHCVLVLRLIGVTFDIFDGQKPPEELSQDQKETALARPPSLIELAGYTYFPASFLAGPQFPFRRYLRFIEGEFSEYHGFVRAGIVRAALGVLYLILWQVGTLIVPESYFLSDAFRNQPLVRRLIGIGLFGKVSLYKYVFCWLLVEGAMMCTGFTYAGKADDGTDDWSACTNVKLILLETAICLNNYVQSFNMSTNSWVAQYVYKRLKFLNNRMVSYVAALAFLSVWHGFHSGYYMTFLVEFSIATMERQIEEAYNEIFVSKYGDVLENSWITRSITYSLLKAYNFVLIGYCMVPFVMLTFDRWGHVYEAANYFGFVAVGSWTVLYGVLRYSGAFKEVVRAPSPAPAAADLSTKAE